MKFNLLLAGLCACALSATGCDLDDGEDYTIEFEPREEEEFDLNCDVVCNYVDRYCFDVDDYEGSVNNCLQGCDSSQYSKDQIKAYSKHLYELVNDGECGRALAMARYKEK